MTEAAPDTIDSVLRSDHAAITRALADLRAGAAPAAGAQFADLSADIVRHFVAEEQYLLPTVRETLPDGHAISQSSFAEHERIENMLKELDDGDTRHERVGVLMSEIGAALTEHISTQESDLFPALVAKLDATQQAELGQDVLGAEQLAPTHPRYFVPKSATLSKITSWLSGLVEKGLDARD